MAFPLTFEESGTARPLFVLRERDFPTWLREQPGGIRRWVESAGFRAEAGKCLLLPQDGAVGAAVGITGAAGLQSAASWPAQLPAGAWAPRGVEAGQMEALAWFWCAGAYRFDRYRDAVPSAATLELPPQARSAELAVTSLYLIRDLVNTPTEDMGPRQLAQCAQDLASAFGAEVNIISGNHLLSSGYPAVHAVGRAAARKPRLIELIWGEPDAPKLCLAGKGVCFDTGGLDLKNADFMRNMKKDMGGAAHVLGLSRWIMARELPLRLRTLIPAVENAVSGNAYRPGDVISTRKGLSVEIHNTDAEGRVVLADALAAGAEDSPDLLLDFATLTGAARIALGPDIPALYANDDELAEGLLSHAGAQGEPLWRMPLHAGYEAMLDSSVADMSNATPSRLAGSITAALFLQRFVPGNQKWAHLDIYAWNDNPAPGRPPGGEAQALRGTFAYIAERFAG